MDMVERSPRLRNQYEGICRLRRKEAKRVKSKHRTEIIAKWFLTSRGRAAVAT